MWVVCQNLIPIQFICTWLFSMFNLLQGTFGFLIFKVINSVNIESSVKYDDLSFNKFYTERFSFLIRRWIHRNVDF